MSEKMLAPRLFLISESGPARPAYDRLSIEGSYLPWAIRRDERVVLRGWWKSVNHPAGPYLYFVPFCPAHSLPCYSTCQSCEDLSLLMGSVAHTFDDDTRCATAEKFEQVFLTLGIDPLTATLASDAVKDLLPTSIH